MRFSIIFPATIAVFVAITQNLIAQEVEYITLDLEGWSVEVETELTAEDNQVGQQAIRIVTNQLYDLKFRLPSDRVQALQSVVIRINRDHQLKTAQYHPSRRWLVDNGHDPNLVRKVHIPNAQRFLDLCKTNRQPFVVLHELAHAYHDQVLGFGNEKIRSAYEKAISDGKYDRVLSVGGRKREHYAKTSHKEFFAEMTEALLGTNDFYPFVYGELKQFDRPTFDLLSEIWIQR